MALVVVEHQAFQINFPLQKKMIGIKIDGNAISKDIRGELKERCVVVVNVRVRDNESGW